MSELHGSFLTVNAINPFAANITSSRLQMHSSHIGSSLTVKKAEPRLCTTLYEVEYGKYTFSRKAKCDMIVIKTLAQYRESNTLNGIKFNPRRFVVYEDFNSNEIGLMELERYHCIHKDFGFRFRDNPNVSVHKGSRIPEGTIISDSTSINENRDYCYGLNVDVAFLSHHSVIEDGVWASNEICEAMTTPVYGSREGSWGRKWYPLNTYGDEINYKIFPDIGDVIREDGLIFAFREHDELLAPVQMTPKALRTVDYLHDMRVYGQPGARVVDVTVYRDPGQCLGTPTGMSDQANKYANAMNDFYEELIAEYERIYKDRNKRGGIRITKEFKTVLERAYAFVGKQKGKRSQFISRGVPLDEFYIEIVYEYDFVPGIGSKISTSHGGKGVICKKTPVSEMPLDADGDHAHIVTDGDSIIKRTNNATMFEQAVNAFGRRFVRDLRERCGLSRRNPDKQAIAALLSNVNNLNTIYDEVIEYYDTLSPLMAIDAKEYCSNQAFKLDHIQGVLESEDLRTYCPTDTPKKYHKALSDLRRKYGLTRGSISYVTDNGRNVTTKNDVLIGKIYIILLDKIGSSPAAVSSSKVQHFGIPAKLTNLDKYSNPFRPQPTRFWGETEVRVAASYVAPEFIAETLDRSNNPTIHKAVCRAIYMSKNPMQIESVTDSHASQVGGRIAVYTKHKLACAGARFVKG